MMIRNQAVWSGKADAANKKRVLRLKPFCQAPGFSGLNRQGKSGAAAPIFNFVSVMGYPIAKGFLKTCGEAMVSITIETIENNSSWKCDYE